MSRTAIVPQWTSLDRHGTVVPPACLADPTGRIDALAPRIGLFQMQSLSRGAFLSSQNVTLADSHARWRRYAEAVDPVTRIDSPVRIGPHSTMRTSFLTPLARPAIPGEAGFLCRRSKGDSERVRTLAEEAEGSGETQRSRFFLRPCAFIRHTFGRQPVPLRASEGVEELRPRQLGRDVAPP